MTEKYSVTDLLEVVKNNKVPPHCDLTLQIKAVSAEEGSSYGIWTIDEKFVNGHKVVMGGFQTAAADIMMAYAISSVLDEDQTFATVDLHTTYHRPIFIGTAEIYAKVVNHGKKTAYLTAEIYQNDKKCCSTISSVMIL